MNLTRKQKLHFWSKVNIKGVDDCWTWRAGTCRGGYGQAHFNGKHYRANRVAWALANGREPLPHLDICHSCDNPKCCNPNHLSENTRQWNIKDAISKGRLSPPPPRWRTLDGQRSGDKLTLREGVFMWVEAS